MKKKLLIIGLICCCVWGAMAAENKLLNAIKNCDLDTVKVQIELLDVDVNERVDGCNLLEYAIGVWCALGEDNFVEQYKAPSYYKEKFYKESDKYKPVIQYLLKKGTKVSDSFIQRWMDRSDKYHHSEILKYILDNKIIDMKQLFEFKYYRYGTSDMNAHYSTVSVSDYYYGVGFRKDNGKDWIVKSILISQYAPIPADYMSDYKFFTILQGDIAGVKNLIKSGTEIDAEFQLFISSKAIADLLKATDNYKLKNFNGVITPYYVGTVIPKYCTQCLTQDEIALMKLIADYNSSMNRKDAVAKVKLYIANGVDVNKKQYVLSGASIIELPIMIAKMESYDILSEALYGTKEERAQRAKEKAEAERIARIEQEKKVEEDLITNYLAIFSNDVRDILMIYGTMKKGKYKIKSKDYVSMVQRNRLYNEVLIRESMSGKTVLVSNNLHNDPYKFSIADGYTVEMVQKVWNMAVDKLCDEFGLQ